jgi:hypothetical protein
LVACTSIVKTHESGASAAEIVPDEKLLEIDKRIPGFGGMYIDEDGDLNVYLVQDIKRLNAEAVKNKQAEIKTALEDIVDEDILYRVGAQRSEQKEKVLDKQTRKIVIIQGKFKIIQLEKWRVGIDSALEIPGVVFTDLDEKENRLKIGTESSVLREQIDELLDKIGVPRDAVIIEKTKPIRFHTSLRDKFRKVPGGVQIEADTGWFSYNICTMGLNAIRSGVDGFITNSHCTTTQGGSEGTDFHQPDDPWSTEGNKIGDEIADPAYFTGGACPSGRKCRYSDSAFIDYTISRGRDIARTTGWNNGSLTLSNSSPRLTIVGEAFSWVDGGELDKIGRTTGWTYGRVNGTCQNINVADTNITLLCQYRVNRIPGHTHTMSDHGDSGSPVFRWLGSYVLLAGILWGGQDDGSSFVFSPMNQIEQELGQLKTYDPTGIGALKVSAGIDGHPWIVTSDGAIYGYNGSGWDQKEAPGTADDLALCGTFMVILTRPDSQGIRSVKSRDVFGGVWTTYPAIGPPGAVGLKQVACDGYEPVVLAAPPNYSIFKFDENTQSWGSIHDAATSMSVMNSRLFFTYPTTTTSNVWSRDVDGGPYQRWGDTLVADKIAGDANGYPWVATNAASNPLFKWDTTNRKWTFGFGSGPVYDMDIQSYIRMYILSDPQIYGGGYSLYSHELYSGGWTTYSLPSN